MIVPSFRKNPFFPLRRTKCALFKLALEERCNFFLLVAAPVSLCVPRQVALLERGFFK